MAFDNLSFNGQSLNYDPLKSKIFDQNQMSGGTSSLGGAGYQAYLKPMSQGGIGNTFKYESPLDQNDPAKTFDFGKDEPSYSPLNYKPTQSEVLGGSGSGMTDSIGNKWQNLSDKQKSNTITGAIGLLGSLFDTHDKDVPMQVQAPNQSWKPHVGQLDMKQFNSRIQTSQPQTQATSLKRVI